MPNVPDAVIRLGVVGGGLIAQLAHLPALRALDRLYTVAALAEPDRSARDALARRYGIAAAYPGHAELLDRCALDALLVCSPNGTHAEVVLDALDAGLHVLVEKPLCLAPADADAIVARSRAAGRVVQVGYMKRFDPAYERLLDALPALGAVRAVTSFTVDPGIGERLRPAGFVAAGDTAGADPAALVAAPGAADPADLAATARAADPADLATAARAADPAEREQVACAVGSDDPRHVVPFSRAFQGALVHDVNLVLGALGGGWRPLDGASAADGSLAHGTLAQGGGARWTATWALAPGAGAFREELTFLGAGSVARLRFPAPYLGAAPAELTLDGTPARRWSEPANAYVRQLEHFHACVTRGEPCRTPAEQGAADVALLTALYRVAAGTARTATETPGEAGTARAAAETLGGAA